MIHDFHLVTAAAYVVVGAVFFGCGLSSRFRHSLLRHERDREVAFNLTAVFVYACAVEHGAHALGAPHEALMVTAVFESIVSAFTALFFVVKAAVQWKG